MDYKVTYTIKDNYLHASVEGRNSPQTVQEYLKEISEKCLRLQCKKVLIEENLEGPGLDTIAIFDIVERASKNPPMKFKIAFIDLNENHDTASMQFAETVAVNRGMDVKQFSNYHDAEGWLLYDRS